MLVLCILLRLAHHNGNILLPEGWLSAGSAVQLPRSSTGRQTAVFTLYTVSVCTVLVLTVSV